MNPLDGIAHSLEVSLLQLSPSLPIMLLKHPFLNRVTLLATLKDVVIALSLKCSP